MQCCFCNSHVCRVLSDITIYFFLIFCFWLANIWLFSYLLWISFFPMFSWSPMRFAHLAVSPLNRYLCTREFGITGYITAVCLVCASVTKSTRACATQGMKCWHLVESVFSPACWPCSSARHCPGQSSLPKTSEEAPLPWWSSQAGQDYPHHHQRQAGIRALDTPPSHYANAQ